LRPPNALILTYDHLDGESAEVFESQIAEVRRYYQLVKLSEIAQALDRGQALGMAAVVFRNSRKSLFLRAMRLLRTENIPVTIFLRADCQGTNRLPAEEELRLYQKHYPGSLTDSQVEELLQLGWRQPAELENYLNGCRTSIGPFPLNELDPTTYFSTWGSLMEFPPEQLEAGFYIGSGAQSVDSLNNQLTFVRQQTRQPVRIGYWPKDLESAQPVARELGLQAVLTTRRGAVESGTSPWELPQWGFESKNSDGENEKNEQSEQSK
jgi:hypothetical protein